MRLHRLAFTAIGPFADTEVIDFTVFDDAGLFLLGRGQVDAHRRDRLRSLR